LVGKLKVTPVRKTAAKKAAVTTLPTQHDPETLGTKLREERLRQDIALRELARRVGVSPSLISQIERGLVSPSVGTLWSMTTELGLVMDELFSNAEQSASSATSGDIPETPISDNAKNPVQRRQNRKRIRLAGGVEWERLTAQADDEVEFLYVKYEAGAESCPKHSLFRHGGKEYAYILSGRLGVQIGFEEYELGPGDSVSFHSQLPHRLWAIGNEPAIAIWTVINRTDDTRSGS
jgi:transcriptional regulator with XRE-family HTH domain